MGAGPLLLPPHTPQQALARRLAWSPSRRAAAWTSACLALVLAALCITFSLPSTVGRITADGLADQAGQEQERSCPSSTRRLSFRRACACARQLRRLGPLASWASPELWRPRPGLHADAQGACGRNSPAAYSQPSLVVVSRKEDDTSWLDVYLGNVSHVVYQHPDFRPGLQPTYSMPQARGEEASMCAPKA